MGLKNILLILFNFAIYLFVFLFMFFIIYRFYIYCFGIDPHPCMNDKCIRERETQFTQS